MRIFLKRCPSINPSNRRKTNIRNTKCFPSSNRLLTQLKRRKLMNTPSSQAEFTAGSPRLSNYVSMTLGTEETPCTLSSTSVNQPSLKIMLALRNATKPLKRNKLSTRPARMRTPKSSWTSKSLMMVMVTRLQRLNILAFHSISTSSISNSTPTTLPSKSLTKLLITSTMISIYLTPHLICPLSD